MGTYAIFWEMQSCGRVFLWRRFWILFLYITSVSIHSSFIILILSHYSCRCLQVLAWNSEAPEKTSNKKNETDCKHLSKYDSQPWVQETCLLICYIIIALCRIIFLGIRDFTPWPKSPKHQKTAMLSDILQTSSLAVFISQTGYLQPLIHKFLLCGQNHCNILTDWC